jgi:SAM-dependent methyltransferase
MTTTPSTPPQDIFRSPAWYDRSINWEARLGREVPVLVDVFGPPGAGGLVDAGCGPARGAEALAGRGYRVTGVDRSPEMLDLARRRVAQAGAEAAAQGCGGGAAAALRFVESDYAAMATAIGGGHDGVFCQANSLAAAGSRAACAAAVGQFAACLRPGGRLFVQVLNFAAMRGRRPCVIGPRVSRVDGVEYVSVRQFLFREEMVEVTSISLWQAAGGWQQHADGGSLYAVTRGDMHAWCAAAGLHIDHEWGDYARSPFDEASSGDYIVVATRHAS